jgi:16S rRNA (adenine1518-N6/adenine1519-N6)-dimethyltransferase
LRSGASCQPLIEFLRPLPCRVLEIGPGDGVLTRRLLASEPAPTVWAWELDPAWAFRLRRDAGPHLQIVAGDALEIPWARLPAGIAVAGNLPYNVATPLVERWLTRAKASPRAAFLVQWEVGERLVARPGERAYGALSVAVAMHAEAVLVGRVGRGAFVPVPKVDGAFVGLIRRPPPVAAADLPHLTAVVRAAFAARRKTLRNSLAMSYGNERAAAVLAACGMDPRRRAETWSLADFVRLARELAAPSTAVASRGAE